jgi:hypothetical protein
MMLVLYGPLPTTDTEISVDPHKIYASFYMPLLDSKLGLNVGVKYAIPVTGDEWDGAAADWTLNTPVAVGLGAQYVFGDAFTLKARLASTFAGSKETDGVTVKYPFNIGISLNPVISVGGVKIHIDGSVVIADVAEKFSWHVNPVIQKTVGPGTFFAGVNLQSIPDGKADSLAWAIPIGIIVGF